MLFWTIVSFAAYSIVYFIVSQLKMRKMKKDIHILKRRLNMKTASNLAAVQN